MINPLLNSPEGQTAGLAVACLSLLNSFFEVFNPVLTGIFYIVSITWLGIQMYYKIKKSKDEPR